MDNKYIKALLWFVLISFYVLITTTLGSLIRSLNIKNSILLNSLYIVAEAFVTCIMVFLYRKDFKNKFKELNNEDGSKIIKDSIKIWLTGLFFMIALNIILSFVVGNIATNEETNRSVISTNSIYAFISMIILAPISEEIIFRLSPSKMFNNKYIYILFSGLIFGLAHVIGSSGLQLLYIFPYAALGFSFAYIYNKYQNILCSTLMHMIHNMICIILIMFIA